MIVTLNLEILIGLHFLVTKILIQQAGSGVCLSNNKIIQYLLEGTAASHLENDDSEDKDVVSGSVVRGKFSCIQQ